MMKTDYDGMLQLVFIKSDTWVFYDEAKAIPFPLYFTQQMTLHSN